jgi:NAD(P)-dependent dehydrogenase (short-subunit alcohol dehydrogenase family)
MSQSRDYRHKVVVITGAAGGLGRAFAARFGRTGAKVALLDLRGDLALTAADELRAEGIPALGLGCDVSVERDCAEALAKVCDHFGGVDVLVNNAGITHRSAFKDTIPSVFRRVMEVNFFGALYCTRAALPSLIERKGQIIVISSIAGFAPLLGRTGYSAAKHALHGLFESLRCELTGERVSVLMVCPGFTDTNIYRSALDGDGSITSHPQSTVGRVASPNDVAEAVFRAASRERRLLVLSGAGRLAWLMMKFAPGLYEKLMTRSLSDELARPAPPSALT